MPTRRCFRTDVEALAKEWREGGPLTSGTWTASGNPGAKGGEAQGFFVNSDGLTGYAKPSKKRKNPDEPPRAAHEKIASDLAYDLELPIPPVRLWKRAASVPDDECCCAISLVPFRPAHKWGIIENVPDAAQRVRDAISDAASAMSVFDTWVDNQDRMNPGNLLVNEDLTGGIIRYAYIDYAYSLSYGWRDGPAPAVARVVGPYPANIKPNTDVIAETVTAIETLPEQNIRDIVSRVSDDFITPVRRAAIIEGLLQRRGGLRGAMRQTYGAPL